jgi:hypothetical protein
MENAIVARVTGTDAILKRSQHVCNGSDDDETSTRIADMATAIEEEIIATPAGPLP